MVKGRDNPGRMSVGNETATEEEMLAAAKACHADGFIRRLPQGLRYTDSGGWRRIITGTKQLLCITRVMLSHPSMLILDEATSSIDTRTEVRIQEAFEETDAGSDQFYWRARLSTIQEADVILVMKDGHIIEQGNHNELMQKKGFYYTFIKVSFWEKQYKVTNDTERKGIAIR